VTIAAQSSRSQLAALSSVGERATPVARRPRGFGLRVKFLLFASIAFVASGLVFGWAFSRQFETMLRIEFQKRGETFIRGLAANGRLDVWSGNKERLGRLVKGALEEPDVVAAAVFNATGDVLARDARSGAAAPATAPRVPRLGIEVEARAGAGGSRLLAFRAPVTLQREQGFELLEPGASATGPQTVGLVEIVFGLEEVERRIGEVQATTMRITGGIVGVGIVLVVLLSRIFVTPIERVAATARRIAAGDRRLRAQVASRDELGELADAFNTMTEALAEREEDLRRMNLGLEKKVRERTSELEIKQQELIVANVELERASRLKSEFLANMSHELRTPLNAVNGFSELLLEELHGPLTPKQRRYVDNILGSGRHLLQLINDILDLSKIEAGRMEVRYEDLSLKQVVDGAVGVIQPLAQQKGLAVESAIDPSIERVRLDPGKAKQILYNLMSNAVKFTDQGGVTVSAARVEGAPDWFELCVADTGIGIGPEDQGRIFREFEQVDGSHSRKYAGTGLGLALTRKLVEIHGGTIRVESEVGRGSRFIARLPIAGPLAGSRSTS
jgi:signal transduction histidine kinase